MSSIAITRPVPRNPADLAHVLNGKLGSLEASDDAPVVFLVDGEGPEDESLVSLIRSNGWRPRPLASAQELFNLPSTFVPCCLIVNVFQDSGVLDIEKRLRVERPEIPMILITSLSDVRMAVQAMKAGAADFLAKPFSDDVLLSAIRQGLERSRLVLDYEMETHDLRNCYASLSRRERQVMRLVVSGLLNKQVGAELGISEITVKAHRRQVMRKMRANSLPDLVRMASELGPLCPTIHFA